MSSDKSGYFYSLIDIYNSGYGGECVSMYATSLENAGFSYYTSFDQDGVSYMVYNNTATDCSVCFALDSNNYQVIIMLGDAW